MADLPRRRTLSHEVPDWVEDGSLYFVTICCATRGRNQLSRPGIGDRLLESAAYYQRIGRWWLQVFLLMPDHLHAILAVPREKPLPEVMRGWKAYQAKTLGIRWQSGFFDHRLRSDESEQEKVDYILLNPVRAGLVNRPEDWPYYFPKKERLVGTTRPT